MPQAIRGARYNKLTKPAQFNFRCAIKNLYKKGGVSVFLDLTTFFLAKWLTYRVFAMHAFQWARNNPHITLNPKPQMGMKISTCCNCDAKRHRISILCLGSKEIARGHLKIWRFDTCSLNLSLYHRQWIILIIIIHNWINLLNQSKLILLRSKRPFERPFRPHAVQTPRAFATTHWNISHRERLGNCS